MTAASLDSSASRSAARIRSIIKFIARFGQPFAASSAHCNGTQRSSGAVSSPSKNDGAMRFAQVRGLKGFKIGDDYDEAKACAPPEFIRLSNWKSENPTGFLGIGKPPSRRNSADEEESLKALFGLAASSIANAQAHSETRRFNQELNEKIQELRALLDLVRGLTSTLEPEEVARLLVLTLSGRWAVGKYALAVCKNGHPTVERQKELRCRRSKK
jgi:hypothetical protein